MRSRTTFNKRQKEAARQEKARDKAAKRQERKAQKGEPGYVEEEEELQPLSAPNLELFNELAGEPKL